MTTNAPKFAMHSKIRLLKDHNGKPVKGYKYGYVVCIHKEGFAYLIRTSCFGGMLWYSEDALRLAGGKHELQAWCDKLRAYNDGEL